MESVSRTTVTREKAFRFRVRFDQDGESFCTVTESVRRGIDVKVAVTPVEMTR